MPKQIKIATLQSKKEQAWKEAIHFVDPNFRWRAQSGANYRPSEMAVNHLYNAFNISSKNLLAELLNRSQSPVIREKLRCHLQELQRMLGDRTIIKLRRIEHDTRSGDPSEYGD